MITRRREADNGRREGTAREAEYVSGLSRAGGDKL